MKPTTLQTLLPALLLSLLLSVGCKKDKEGEDKQASESGGATPSGGGGTPGGAGGGPGGGPGGPGGPGGMGPGGEGEEGGEFGPGGGEFGGPGGGQRQQTAQIDPNKPVGPQLSWSVSTGRRQPPNLDIRAIYLGKSASIIVKTFGKPLDAQAVGSNGVWTYPGMKIRDAQGKTYNAVKFTIQPTQNNDGKVIAVVVIPGAIAGGGGQNAGAGPGGPGGGPGAP